MTLNNNEFPWTPALLQWFEVNQRPMPWRQTSTPYYRWLSEIMLQQTRVDTVIPYFHRFVERFPRVEHLAEASEDEVLKLWEGLGYYSRARNLLKAARVMVAEHQGTFPATEKEALALPGIGPYSAAAVLSMAYGVPLPSVDGNVLRVYARLTALAENVLEPATVKRVQGALKTAMPQHRPGDFNEAMMELGAVICLPVSPLCQNCPIQDHCEAHRQHRVEQLPLRIKKDRTTRHHYLVMYLQNAAGTCVAAQKNPPSGLLGGLWAFPMMEVTADHEDMKALPALAAKEAVARWQITLQQPEAVGRLRHVFSHRHWTMWVVSAVSEELPPACEWLPHAELSVKAFPEVYQKVMRLMDERAASI
ncbi:A/G-specific adenine glycosylase [Anoxynatronum buryatiense]|uniref:Adenine DNA glycosylase n=1 Tax=Anoxynatronum buryatiense TaxID=489973 RepID=A0AA46AJE1_9CLOT|nr:A/G-specific adenine glycosylase [Anoxynatronum buryatiense]SMP60433.1 A/G-specific DNA-adenine glycosylase [Anoxynatronum buryatiense]